MYRRKKTANNEIKKNISTETTVTDSVAGNTRIENVDACSETNTKEGKPQKVNAVLKSKVELHENKTKVHEGASGSSHKKYKTQKVLMDNIPEGSDSSVSEKVAEADAKVTAQRSKKSKMWSLIFLLINIAILAVVLAFQLSSDAGVLSFGDLIFLSGNNLWFLLAAFGTFLLLMFFRSLRYQVLLHQATKVSRPFLSYKVAAVGRYYECLTPLATGGQPFQIYYMTKRGVKGSTASSVPLAEFIYVQFAFVFTCTSVLIFSEVIAGGLDHVLYTIAVVSTIVNFTLMALLLFLSVSKKIGPRLTIGVLKLLTKMRIIKNYQATYRKVMRFVHDYQKTMRYYMSNIFTTLTMLAVSFLLIFLNAVIVFFVCCTFKGFDITLLPTIFLLMVLLDAIMCFVPWPGAGGVAEVSFQTLFAHSLVALPGGTIFWAMLLWRFFSYYIFLFQGGGVLVYDYFIGNKKIPRTIERVNEIARRKQLRQAEKEGKLVDAETINASEESAPIEKHADSN